MNDDLFLNKLNKIFSREELADLMKEDMDIPVPDKVRDLINQAKRNVANQKKNSGKIIDIVNKDDPIDLKACAIEGQDEAPKDEDPIKKLLNKTSKGSEKGE